MIAAPSSQPQPLDRPAGGRVMVTPPPLTADDGPPPGLLATRPRWRDVDRPLIALAGFLLVTALVAWAADASLLVSLPVAASAMAAFLLALRPAPAVPARRALAAPPLRPVAEAAGSVEGLLDTMGQLVVRRAADGRILRANKALAELVGTTPRAMRGRQLREFGIDLAPPAAGSSPSAGVSGIDLAVSTRGATRWFSWHESVHMRGATAEYQAVAREITLRKAAGMARDAALRKARESARDKARFLATVGHEIRTPINGVMGMAQLLSQTQLTPEQSTYVGAINTSSSALIALIEDLMQHASLESGRVAIEPSDVSPRELLENVCELLAPRAQAKQIGLGLHIAQTVPETMRIDGGKLRQVWLNLIGNAIKFTDEGGVRVTLALAHGERGAVLRLAVADTGPGLTRDDLQRIFKAFGRVGPGTENTREGIGLGLFISKRIVGAMGGRIRAAGRPGRGSLFTVDIPAGDVAPGIARKALTGRRILILSRERMEADALALTIRDHDGAAHVARTAEEAAAEHPPGGYAAVIVDAEMETPQGALLARLRASGVEHGPAVTLIAPRHRSRLADYRAHGYAHFLLRPVRRDTLMRILLSQIDPATMPQRPSPVGPETGEPAGLSILIAEDNEVNALLARAALVRAGHAVEVVTNGRAAVERIIAPSGRRFDVVLMDMHMPVMDGLEAIGRIRDHERQHLLAPLPILVLSADTQTDLRRRVLAYGATGFMSKPVDPAALQAAMDTHGVTNRHDSAPASS